MKSFTLVFMMHGALLYNRFSFGSPLGVLISSSAGGEQPGPEQQIPRTIHPADAAE